MCIMGCIKSIDPAHLTVALPGRINGRVPVTSITQSYLNIVNRYVSDEESKAKNDNNEDEQENKESDYLPLDKLFTVGQVVCTKVAKVEVDKASHVNVELTMMPCEIHSEYRHSAITKGMVLCVGIAEREEHGYVIETGVKNLRGFLPEENLNDEDKNSLIVGSTQFCRVGGINSSTAASTAIFKLAKDIKFRTVKYDEDVNVNYILPGTITEFRVTKILKDGLQGNIFNGALNGYINEHQLGNDDTKSQLFVQPKDFEKDDVFTARILYVMPLTKLVYLSLNLQQEFTVTNPEDSKKILPLGTIIEDARVSHIGTGGIVLKLRGGKYKGIVSLRSIRNKITVNFDNDTILAKYSKNSIHKVRVIHYDPIDLLHICSVDQNVLNEKYFSSDYVNIGDIIIATVKRKILDGRYEVQLGAVTGFIHPIYLAPGTLASMLEPGSKLRCRVICKSARKQEIYVTNRKELIAGDAQLLKSRADVKVHASFLGCVRKYSPEGWFIEFCDYIRGVVFRNRLTSGELQVANRFYVGQIAKFTIKYVNKSAKGVQMVLGLSDFRVDIGEVLKGTVSSIQPNGLDVAFVAKNVNGSVPIMYLSDFPSLVHALHSSFHGNEEVEAIGVSNAAYSIRDVKHPQTGQTYEVKTLKSLEIGEIIPAFIKDVDDEVIDITCLLKGFEKSIKIHLKMFLENYASNSNINLVPDQKIYVKILSKDLLEQTLTCSARLHDVWQSGGLTLTARILQRYFSDIEQIKNGLVNDKHPILKYQIGDVVEAEIINDKEAEEEGKSRATTTLLLPGNIKVLLTNANDDIKTKKKGGKEPGAKHSILIIWVDYVNQVVYGTTKSRYFDRLKNEYDENAAPTALLKRQGLKSDVLLILDDVIILFPRKVTKKFIYVPTRLHYNDFQPVLSKGISEGAVVNVTTIDSSQEHFIGIFDNYYRLYESYSKVLSAKKDADVAETEVPKKRKKLESGEAANVTHTPAKNKKEKRKIPKKTTETAGTIPGFSLKLSQLDGADDFDDSEDDDSDYHSATEKQQKNKQNNIKKPVNQSQAQNSKKNQLKKKQNTSQTESTVTKFNKRPAVLPGVSNFWSSDLSVLENKEEPTTSSDDSSDEDTEPGNKKKKLTPQERFQAARDEEERIREIEERNADKNTPLTTVDQFERSVLAEPHSSLAWINYIVFHVEATELDRARAIARRALQTINYRESQERLNVWIALLNLELRYGNKEAFNDVLKEALQVNEPFKVYTACLHIFVDCKMIQELCDMVLTVTKKFRQMPESWLNAAQAYFEVDLPDKAKLLLNRALTSLPERDRKYA